MNVYLCPGFHYPHLTRSFLANLPLPILKHDRLTWGILPSHVPPYSPHHVIQALEVFLQETHSSDFPPNCHPEVLSDPEPTPAIVWIGFSAGVVGALGAARQWQSRGNQVLGFIAVDSWGLPLWADFPIYTLSRDWAKPSTTTWAGRLTRYFMPDSLHFYAEPAVSHLSLWESPHLAQGWQQDESGLRQRTTAAEFIGRCLAHLVVKRYTPGGNERPQSCH